MLPTTEEGETVGVVLAVGEQATTARTAQKQTPGTQATLACWHCALDAKEARARRRLEAWIAAG